MSPNDAATTLVDIDGVQLAVLRDNNDASWYEQRGAFEERRSGFYPLLAQAGFGRMLDVGANYGFVSLLAQLANPHLNVVAVEADPRLCPLIRRNLVLNGASGVTVVNAVVGASADGTTGFSLNPSSTLDNRVSMHGWQRRTVERASVDALIGSMTGGGRLFVKIDTQGYEPHVFAGAEHTLAAETDWIVKSEFAPAWLRSQGTDPVEFLRYLVDRYVVAEAPARLSFGVPSIDDIFGPSIAPSDIEAFVRHVQSLNQRGRGWVDVYLRPRRGEASATR